MSSLEETIIRYLKQLFPHARIKSQHMVKYQGQTLIFDMYLEAFNLLIECQGEQHYKMTPHFHKSEREFHHYQWHDSLKVEWAEQQSINLLRVDFNAMPTSPMELFKMIQKVRT